MKLYNRIAIGLAVVGLPFAAYAATGQAGHARSTLVPANAPKPKISRTQATRIALAKAHGKIAATEYEKENGSWRWSFDIRQNGKIHEIGVDGQSGKIVENSWESAGKGD